MAARQSNHRSSNKQASTVKKQTTQRRSNNNNDGGSKRSSTNDAKQTKPTKEEIATQSALYDEITLVVTLVLSVLLILANFDLGGFIGAAINEWLLGIFGCIAYVVPIAMFVGVAFHISNRGSIRATKKLITGSVFLITCMVLFQMFSRQYDLTFTAYYKYAIEHNMSGGILGGMLCKLFVSLFGVVGTYVVLIANLFLCLILFTGKRLLTSMGKLWERRLIDLKQRYLEGAALRREYRKQRVADSQYSLSDSATKRRARTVTLKKTYEIDEETGEIYNEETTRKVGKPDVEMEEIQPNLDHVSFAGSYIETPEIPTYEEVLQEKFGTTLDIDDDIHSDELEEQSRDSYDAKENPLAEPCGEASVTIQEVSDVHRDRETEEALMHKAVEPAKVASTSKSGEDISTDEISKEVKKIEEKPYVFPSLDLLEKPEKTSKGMTQHDLKETAFKLQTTLESFGVRATITNVTCGPSVTRYEIQPEQGVKVSTITKLSDDIKLNLAATDIRIEAPIPGKAAVGIEVPNKKNTMVTFRELIENKEFVEYPSNLAFAVGKDISGQSIITDIAKMPHLMIAGATGSGKSVCINTLIMSILYKADPNDVKLIMVDPKVVELSIYNGIPHLMIPVVTDPKKANAALNWAVVEMEERYNKFSELGVRDLKSYNAKIKKVEYLNDERYKKIPQLVIIVDELADLMMVAKGDVEEAICRLAQKARAAGIHLVIATQRPSVNVITGLIKANVPSRIAFAVSSSIDSRTIIDGSGAEKLLGKGDMLFFPQGYPKPVRLQGAFISDKEVSAVVEFLSQQTGETAYHEEVMEQITSTSSGGNASVRGSDLDDYFVQAGKFIIEKDKASATMLQRVYKIGFNRASRIMEQLFEAGVIGPEEGTKPRKVIMSLEEFEQYVEESV